MIPIKGRGSINHGSGLGICVVELQLRDLRVQAESLAARKCELYSSRVYEGSPLVGNTLNPQPSKP